MLLVDAPSEMPGGARIRCRAVEVASRDIDG